MMLSVEAAARTHIGLVRRRNEDACYQGDSLYVVADGLGGHVAGDIASTTAIAAVMPYDKHVAADRLADTLGKAVNDADNAIRHRIREEPELAGMGTTMVAMLRSGESAVLAHIGDSRAYLLRGRRTPTSTFVQLTEDHTYQQLLSDAESVPHLPAKIARFLDGRKDGRSPDLIPLRLRPGDRILLCTDGLSSYVPAATIENALAGTADPAEVAENLVSFALAGGGKDNITVIVIDVTGAEPCGN